MIETSGSSTWTPSIAQHAKKAKPNCLGDGFTHLDYLGFVAKDSRVEYSPWSGRRLTQRLVLRNHLRPTTLSAYNDVAYRYNRPTKFSF